MILTNAEREINKTERVGKEKVKREKVWRPVY